ncbi:MAG: peptide deformylase [Proteobacteria bacterium]|jgi:peptide deformylase|nr:peptide deformylase [Pseudomonadota bacterium]MBT5065812.1 peptide deformylase [Pseudomonadota bacterium]MBT6192292.1 peptide deformylase [Pseudomonadota bacterium]MBT6465489.1 peptide deformylase [Pseudomonadota bacterium]MBT6674014.1 peptide deformylase [Pseudomonadota bacterium]
MAIRTILHHPDERLRTRAAEVTKFDENIESLIEDMLDTMYDAPGIGLAATQINIHLRVIVVDCSREEKTPMHFINPVLLEEVGIEEMKEGCLSVPGVFEEVSRAEKIKIKAQNAGGTVFELEADGLLAVCIQHEIEHLDGKLFVDKLSTLKQKRIRKKLEKIKL